MMISRADTTQGQDIDSGFKSFKRNSLVTLLLMSSLLGLSIISLAISLHLGEVAISSFTIIMLLGIFLLALYRFIKLSQFIAEKDVPVGLLSSTSGIHVPLPQSLYKFLIGALMLPFSIGLLVSPLFIFEFIDAARAHSPILYYFNVILIILTYVGLVALLALTYKMNLEKVKFPTEEPETSRKLDQIQNYWRITFVIWWVPIGLLILRYVLLGID